MEMIYSIAAGIGLSAACGFRIFVPLLLMSIASLTDYFTPAEQLAWIGSYPALVIFGAATAAEMLGYYIPWVDNALDAIATPAAVVAGVLASGAALGDFSPLAQWTLAVVAGGGTAGLVQGGTVAARGTSSATTGGLGNFLVATGEALASVATTLLALIAPLAALVLVIVAAVLMGRWWHRRRCRRAQQAP